MKLIKGDYERILRNHETLWNKNYNIGDYYLQYDYPNNFLVDLFVINDDEDDNISYIKTFPIEIAKKITCKELKKIIKESEEN